ncbi:MAG: glycosyl hydrolase [Acidobacteriia bacterium]|nr:glycosyl hydrolase [Terriglobia bacterium]
MDQDRTRRHFLKLSTLGVAASVAADALPAFAGSTPAKAAPPESLALWVTHADKRFAPAPPVAWRPATGAPAADAILLDPQTKFQEILGFGAAFTDAACYMFNQLAAPAREQLFHELFYPGEMGLSVGRTCIGSSDYATKVYSYADEPDPELRNFSIAHDREYILPMLRLARQVNPGLFLLASPWSPPGWMKTGGSMLGGSMRRKYLPVYAHYLLKFLQAYEAEGVPVQAITTQNEVDTDQDGRMPACIWPQEYEADFVRLHFGPLLERNAMKTKIWLLDHNYNLWGRALDELEIPDMRKYANAIAWHGYVGEPEMMSRVHDAYPGVEMFWTEGGPDYTDPNYRSDWCAWSRDFTAILRNWCRCIIGWNLALDEKGRPNIGPFPCGGLLTIDSQSKEITRSGQYWAFAHYSRVIRRGARRFASHSSAADLHHAAFENPDGQRVLVVTNPGRERTVRVQSAGSVADLSLPADSLTTLLWR